MNKQIAYWFDDNWPMLCLYGVIAFVLFIAADTCFGHSELFTGNVVGKEFIPAHTDTYITSDGKHTTVHTSYVPDKYTV